MTLQLNPDTTDAYESKTLAQMRQLVFDGLGFIDPLNFTMPRNLAELRSDVMVRMGFISPLVVTARTLAQIRNSVKNRMGFVDPLVITARTLVQIRNSVTNRLGLALALSANTDTYTNVYNDVYAALGYAGMASAPPGVATLIGGWISQAQSTLLARIEFDWKSTARTPLFTSGSSLIDATPIRLLAISYGKAHDGSPDAAGWLQQVERYLSDITQRTPPNIVGFVNSSIIDAHNTIYERYELGLVGAAVTLTFGATIVSSGDYTSTASDSNVSQVDSNLVELLVLANLKAKIGQSDAKELMAQYEQAIADLFKRSPPNALGMMNSAIVEAHETVYRRFELGLIGAVTLTFGASIVASGDYTSTASDSNVSQVDSLAVESLALVTLKEQLGQGDAKALRAQFDQYMTDLLKRSPPNIDNIVDVALKSANETIFRRYAVGNTGTTAHSQSAYSTLGRFTVDSDLPSVDDQGVFLLAIANLQQKYGMEDAKQSRADYETYMQELYRRTPPNATSIVNSTLKMTQQMLYRKYDVFRMERWWTWSLIAGERFYGTFSSDFESSLAPTDGLAVIGDPVITHNLVYGRYLPNHVTLNDGTVFITGGTDGNGNILSSSEIYDPATGVFTETGSMSTPRFMAAAVKLDSGDVFVSGGAFGTTLATTEIYQVSTGTFIPGPSFPVGTNRAGHLATLLQDGTVLIAGGDGASTAACVYDPEAGTITTTAGNVAHPRLGSTATLLADGRVLIAGGVNPTYGDTAETYNPVTGLFTSVVSTMAAKRGRATATLLASGQVLIAGGATPVPSVGTALTSADLFDPNTNTFSATGSMANARYSHNAILMANEKVLVASDNNGGTTAEVYDPATGTFAVTSTGMPVGVTFATMDSLQDGRVLIAGGQTGNVNFTNFQAPVATTVNTAMFYDPDTDAFSATGNLTQGNVFYQLVAYTANGESLPSAEFFVAAVPANTSVVITWVAVPDQPFVLGTNVYGRVTGGTKQLIASVPRSLSTYTDDGTIPGDGDLPTINATAGPGALDPRHVTWVGLSFNDNVWNPLIKGIPPMAFGQNINGVPTNYEIRQSLEIWPAPTSTDWKVQIKGYFQPMVFEDDNDSTTLDWQAIYLQSVANAMPRFKTLTGQAWFNQLEIAQAQANATEYVKRLVAGTHMTARYVPGVVLERNAVRPVLVGPYVGYP